MELVLNKFDYKLVPLEVSSGLSVFVEKGQLRIIFRRENFTDHIENLTAGEKRTWTMEELDPFVNFVFVAFNDSCTFHYRLEDS